MDRKINYDILRSPWLTVLIFFVYMIPDSIAVCQVNNPVGSFWDRLTACGQHYVYESFFQRSLWSLFHVMLSMLVLRKISGYFQFQTAPNTWKGWLTTELKLLIPTTLVFGIYALLNAVVFVLFQDRFINDQYNWYTILMHSAIITYLAYHIALFNNIWKIKRDPLTIKIPVLESIGAPYIMARDIKWVEKKGKHYYASTTLGEFKLGYTLQMLEKNLSSKFFARINRSVIANLEYITSYNYWEHEKYILSMVDAKEFVITRKRLVEIKKRLSKFQENQMPSFT